MICAVHIPTKLQRTSVKMYMRNSEIIVPMFPDGKLLKKRSTQKCIHFKNIESSRVTSALDSVTSMPIMKRFVPDYSSSDTVKGYSKFSRSKSTAIFTDIKSLRAVVVKERRREVSILHCFPGATSLVLSCTCISIRWNVLYLSIANLLCWCVTMYTQFNYLFFIDD